MLATCQQVLITPFYSIYLPCRHVISIWFTCFIIATQSRAQMQNHTAVYCLALSCTIAYNVIYDISLTTCHMEIPRDYCHPMSWSELGWQLINNSLHALPCWDTLLHWCLQTELDTSSDVLECRLATDSFCGSRNGSMDKQMAEFRDERLHLAAEYSRLKQQYDQVEYSRKLCVILQLSRLCFTTMI